MPGEAYRDALATAKERISRLEAEAKERGIPLVFDRRPFSAPRTFRLLAAAGLLFTVLFCIRVLWPDEVRYSPVPVAGPQLPRNLAWFEPAFKLQPTGPIAATTHGTPVLVGLLWRRGQHVGELHVAAFDRATLKPRWVSAAVPATWVSANSDRRFMLSVVGEVVWLEDRTGLEYTFQLADGAPIDKKSITPSVGAFEQVPDKDTVADDASRIAVSRYDGFDLHLAGGWLTTVPTTARASRLRFLKVDGDLAFVLVDDNLSVFDAATGAYRGLLEAP